METETQHLYFVRTERVGHARCRDVGNMCFYFELISIDLIIHSTWLIQVNIVE